MVLFGWFEDLSAWANWKGLWGFEKICWRVLKSLKVLKSLPKFWKDLLKGDDVWVRCPFTLSLLGTFEYVVVDRTFWPFKFPDYVDMLRIILLTFLITLSFWGFWKWLMGISGSWATVGFQKLIWIVWLSNNFMFGFEKRLTMLLKDPIKVCALTGWNLFLKHFQKLFLRLKSTQKKPNPQSPLQPHQISSNFSVPF